MPKQRDDCLFCSIARQGAYVHRANGFVAINDINPQAPVHVLVMPEHHVDTFRDVVRVRRRENRSGCWSSSPKRPRRWG